MVTVVPRDRLACDAHRPLNQQLPLIAQQLLGLPQARRSTGGKNKRGKPAAAHDRISGSASTPEAAAIPAKGKDPASTAAPSSAQTGDSTGPGPKRSSRLSASS